MGHGSAVTNPWANLPRTGPFVLPEDRLLVNAINRTAKPDYQVVLEVLPVPFLGSLESAKVILLAKNPGIVKQDFEIFHSSNVNDKDYVVQNRRTLTFESMPPFFYLGRKFSHTMGYKWWSDRLADVVRRCGHDRVAAKLMCIQYFPYHSKKYRDSNPIIPSQRYSFDLNRSPGETRMSCSVAHGGLIGASV